ncbi:MAG: hypothetical protein HOP18_05750 [Deltaproteobacteria bacterium]|nr:hypothetical protein [Deltaproteobacteria bacterium]
MNRTNLSLIVMFSLTLAAAPPAVQAAEFSEAELYLELNNTDGDLGIHSSIDGGAYSLLEIEDPNERVILVVEAAGRLARQGLTQLFFESAEPKFSELDPKEFFRRFPEGTYEIEAISLTGEEIEGSVVLSHVMAAPVGRITVNGIPAAKNCDAVPLPAVRGPVLIDWDPVTTSHPTIGKKGPVKIVRYQFFVQQEDLKLAIDLPPTVTRFQVPAAITALGGQFKFEIIARTASGNNTAIESCYTVSPAPPVTR